jgi:O-antigen ligase
MLGVFAGTCAIGWYYAGRPWVNLSPPTNADEAYSQMLRLGSPFWGQSDYFASIMLMFLPFSLTSRVPMWLRYATALIGGLAIAGTLSRGAILAVALGPIAGILIVAAGDRPAMSLRTLVQAAASLAGLVALLFGAALTRPDVKLNVFSFFGDPYRTSYYQDAVRLIGPRPIIGYGYGSWPALVTGSATKGAHNYYLQVVVESGGIGLILFVAFLGMLLVHSRRLSGDLAFAATTAVAAIVINTAVEASFNGAVFSWLFAMLVGMVLASPISLGGPEKVR